MSFNTYASQITGFATQAFEFAVGVTRVAVGKVRDFVAGLYNNAEGVVILTLAATGLSTLLGEIPFWVTLPMWIESPMVIPVISVLIIYGVIKLMERRNRQPVMA